MRQLKYYVKGVKGKIQVSKGTFLSMERRKNNTKIVKKSKIPIRTSQSLSKNITVKKIKTNIKISRQNTSKFINSSYTQKVSDKKQGLKQCPDTIESLKRNDENDTVISVSDFCFEIQNQNFADNKLQTVQNPIYTSQPQHFKQNYPFALVNFSLNNQRIDEEYFDDSQCEEITWSMINENVRAMTMSLSLSVYDHLYGRDQQ